MFRDKFFGNIVAIDEYYFSKIIVALITLFKWLFVVLFFHNHLFIFFLN